MSTNCLSNYKITRLINGGTFCKLYEGIHIHKQEKVAIKCESSEKGKKILENEINMYLYLKKYKINIPNIKHIGVYENYKYIVMELLDINVKDFFKQKRERIKNKKEIDIDIEKEILEIDNIIIDLFYIVNKFHQRLIVHRDIKPENFIFDKNMNLYIIDLGLSTLDSNRELTSFIGNKLYSSYRCHEKTYVYTYADDLISLVYMLLHLHTDNLPWDESSQNIYKLKKETKFETYYKNNGLYDVIVKKLVSLYNAIHSKNYYGNVYKIINE
jgi:serine/threonine protein kinase